MGTTMGKSGGNFLDSLPSQGTLHVVMLGLDSAGKTTALYRLKFDQYVNTVPTIGFNCEKIQGTIGKAKGIQFLVWDVGGQEKLRPLWRSYTRCTDGILFVVDSVDMERMEEAKMELMRTTKCPENQGVPLLILANKQDLPGAREPKELEKLLGLHELITYSMHMAIPNSISSSTGSIVNYTTSCSSGSPVSSSKACENMHNFVDSSTTIANINSTTKDHQSLTDTTARVSVNLDNDGGSSQTIIQQKQPITFKQLLNLPESNVLTTSLGSSAKHATTTSPTSTIQQQHQYSQTSGIGVSPANTNLKHTNSNIGSYKGWYIQPACAITGEGLQEGLEVLYDMILKRRKLHKIYKKKQR